MLETLKWLNVSQRLEVNSVSFDQKRKTGESSQYLMEQYTIYRKCSAIDLLYYGFETPTTQREKKSLYYKGLSLLKKKKNAK